MPMPHPSAPAREFRYDTGRLCLDLLATAHPVDQLDTVLQLRRWCSGAGLVPPGTVLACATPGWLAAFRDLRDIVDGLTRAHLATTPGADGRPGPDGSAGPASSAGPAGPADSAAPAAVGRPGPAGPALPAGPARTRSAAREGAIERLNSLAREAPPAPRAVRAADGTLVRALHAEPGCAALLAAVARDAVDLLTDPALPARLRECEGATCGRVYLDTSRGQRRRWCSSGLCGNRARVARHRQRSTAEAGR